MGQVRNAQDHSDMRTGCQHLLRHTPTDKPFMLRLTRVRLISTLFRSKEQARLNKLELRKNCSS